jgi:hypothetical protein
MGRVSDPKCEPGTPQIDAEMLRSSQTENKCRPAAADVHVVRKYLSN